MTEGQSLEPLSEVGARPRFQARDRVLWAGQGSIRRDIGNLGIGSGDVCLGIRRRTWLEAVDLAAQRPVARHEAADRGGVLAAPRDVAVEARHPGFAYYFIVVQHFQRYTATGFNNMLPGWFFLAVLMVLALPWSPWCAARLAGASITGSKWREQGGRGRGGGAGTVTPQEAAQPLSLITSIRVRPRAAGYATAGTQLRPLLEKDAGLARAACVLGLIELREKHYDEALRLDAERLVRLQRVEQLKAERNAASAEIGRTKQGGGPTPERLREAEAGTW